MKKQILPREFYWHDDVVALSQALLGKILVTKIDNQLTAGMIVETEAYRGAEDKASHAYNHRRTARTEIMYAAGGVAYVYLCYGLHHLFNIVTANKNTPHAILVRAIEPVEGIPVMLKRRNMQKLHPKLTAGPGVLTQALGITKQLSGASLTKSPIWIEESGVKISPKEILAGPRIGIDYAQEHRLLPWRFWIKNNPFISDLKSRGQNSRFQ